MTRSIAVRSTYQDLLARILRADSGIVDATRDAAWARWEFGCKLKAERKGRKLLPAGRLDEVAAEVGRSRSEVQSWMTCAERYPTHQQLSNALDSEPTWRQLRAGLTRKPRPAIGAGGDSDDQQDQESVASQPEPDPGDDLPRAHDEPLSAQDRQWWQRRIAIKDGAIASLRRTVANLEERLEAAGAAEERAQDDDDTLLLDFTRHYMEVNSGGRLVKEWHARQEALEQEYRDSRA